jgi:hypothetical protein
MALGNAGGPGTVAEFESECGECFALIEPGDRIEQRDGAWVHLDCDAGDPDGIDPLFGRPGRDDRWTASDINDMGY